MIKSLAEALNQYQEVNGSREAGEVRSIINVHILRELLTVLDLKDLQNRKPKVVINQIPIAGLVAIADPIFKQSILQLPESDTLQVRRSKWKRFCTWLQQQDWYLSDSISREIILIKSKFNTHIARGTLKTVTALKKKRKGMEKKFRLLEPDWTPSLKEEFQAFDQFCTAVTEWRLKPIRSVTLNQYHERIERILGFQKKQGVSLDQLSLQQLLEPSVLKAYEKWSRDRGLASNTIRFDIKVAIPVAQWVFSQSSPDQDWHNSESVKTVRGYSKAVVDRRDRPHASQEAFEEREISLDQCWEILKYLSWRCKDLEKQHGVSAKVIDAWMDYLLLAFLITTGGRQREARELTFRKITIKSNGDVIVTLSPEEHKTGSKTDKGREYPLFVGPMQQELSANLFYYRDHIRPKNLKHDYVFFTRQNRTTAKKRSRRGDPITSPDYLSNLVSKTVAVVTAHLYEVENTKWTAPHDFRRIIASWVCTYGEPKHLAIYAELLGHDMNELVKRYNKMHPGRLARQASLAYRDIAASENRVREQQSPGSSQASLSVTQMDPSAFISLLKKLIKKLWNALTSNKRASVYESLFSAEREVVDE